MSFEVTRDYWTDFFEILSERRLESRTRIEILKQDMGDQVLSDGLPLNGITVEFNGERTAIDITVGSSPDSHQTHNIKNPSRIAFLSNSDGYGDVLDIEEADGTKTLITFIDPLGILIGRSKYRIVATVA
jgi:hypothetical protein